MSVGSLGRSIAAPAADASRVAAIRNKLDLRSPSDIAGFGERARKDVLAGIDRLLAEVRANPLGDAADRLKAAQGRIEKLDPSELEPRGGLDNLFNGRTARLHRVRRAFEGVGHALQELSADLAARAKKIEVQSGALNGLHEQARTLILELDAYLDAGRARLAEARAAAGDAPTEPADRLDARLEELNRARSAALHQLPLVRVVQNAEAFVAEDLARAQASLDAWRASWSELLGTGKGDRVRPHVPALAESKLKAVQAVGRTLASLADHNARRAEGEARMKAAAAPALKV